MLIFQQRCLRQKCIPLLLQIPPLFQPHPDLCPPRQLRRASFRQPLLVIDQISTLPKPMQRALQVKQLPSRRARSASFAMPPCRPVRASSASMLALVHRARGDRRRLCRTAVRRLSTLYLLGCHLENLVHQTADSLQATQFRQVRRAHQTIRCPKNVA